MADIDNETVVHEPEFAVQPDPTPSIDEQVYGDMPETGSAEAKPEEAKHDPKAEIEDQIAGHEKWMADHSDDARAVQLRLQEVAVLQQKLIELDAPKYETRVRQEQTV